MKVKLQRQVIKLAGAWCDFDMTESIASETLACFGQLKPEEVSLRLHKEPIFFSLQTACIVSYARPFTSNEGLGALTGKLAIYRNAEWQQFHKDLMLMRNKFFAHNDIGFRSIQVSPTFGHPGERGSVDRFVLGASSIRLTWDQFSMIQKMCADRKAILRPEIQGVLGHLYPSTGEPYGPVLLNLEVQSAVKSSTNQSLKGTRRKRRAP